MTAPGEGTEERPAHTVSPEFSDGWVRWKLHHHHTEGWTGTDEGGIQLPEDGSCYLTDWLDEHGEELLSGEWPEQISFPAPVIVEVAGDVPRLYYDGPYPAPPTPTPQPDRWNLVADLTWALEATAIPRNYEQTVAELGPRHSWAERIDAKMHRLQAWAEEMAAHMATAPPSTPVEHPQPDEQNAQPGPADKGAIVEAFLAGFLASGEGWNGEYPFGGFIEEGPPRDVEQLRLKADNYCDELPSFTGSAGEPT